MSFAKLDVEKVNASDFVLGKENQAPNNGSVSFARMLYSPPATSQTPASALSASDKSRVRPSDFSVVVPQCNIKITKNGITMVDKWDDDSRKYVQSPWNANADKHRVTLSLRPNVEPADAEIVAKIEALSQRMAALYRAKHNLSEPHVLVKPATRMHQFEGSDFPTVFLELVVNPTSSFLYNDGTGTVSTFGVVGPFFTKGHHARVLALRPRTVAFRHVVSQEDESIFHYALSIKWEAFFMAVEDPPLDEETGETQEEKSERLAKEALATRQSAVADLVQFAKSSHSGHLPSTSQTDEAEADSPMPDAEDEEEVLLPTLPTPANGSSRKRASMPAESQSLPKPKKARRKKANPVVAGAAGGSGAPPGLNHLLS